jgi:hypothetical protein
VLVIVDQVEELISLSGADERDAFLSLVARALDADPRLRIILIMRSEFLTAFLGHRAGSVIPQPGHGGDAGSRGAGRGDRATGPAGGVTFDPPILPQPMAADASAGDVLPLLAYSCTEPSAQPCAASSLDAELGSAESRGPAMVLAAPNRR